ncbi:MAG: hypothetical protein IJ069_12170 [Prevotella sp.]|nr:hypothetical protein [Prevotella sp.]
MKITKILFYIGVVMMSAGILLHPLTKILLFGGFLEVGEGFTNKVIFGIGEYELLYWMGLILILTHFTISIKKDTTLKIFIALGLAFWGYILYTGELKLIGCSKPNTETININKDNIE